MDKQKKCQITKDLLPLYADKMCSQGSSDFVEEHLKECEDCRNELEDYRYNTGLPEPGEDEKDVFLDFSKKMKKHNFVRVVVAVVIVIAMLSALAAAILIPEFTVEYNDGLLTAKIPEDGGIDVYVNLENYDRVESWSVENADGGLDIYLTVIQTPLTKILKDNDKSDNFWRASSWVCASYQHGGSTTEFFSEKAMIRNIYYVEIDPDDVLYMTDGISFENYETHLIWTGPEQPGE